MAEVPGEHEHDVQFAGHYDEIGFPLRVFQYRTGGAYFNAPHVGELGDERVHHTDAEVFIALVVSS